MMYELNYCVDCGYIRSLKSDLSRRTMLAISLIFFFLHDLTSEKPDTMCYLNYCVDYGYFWSLKIDL